MLENIEMELLSQKSTWPSMLWIWGKRKKPLYALHIQLDHAAQIERDASCVETPGENRMERPVRGLKSIRTGEMRGSATNRYLSRTEPEKRSKPQRKENQDVSEVIPPAVPNAPASKEVQDDLGSSNNPRVWTVGLQLGKRKFTMFLSGPERWQRRASEYLQAR